MTIGIKIYIVKISHSSNFNPVSITLWYEAVLPDYDNTIVVHRVKKLPYFEANYHTSKNFYQLE